MIQLNSFSYLFTPEILVTGDKNCLYYVFDCRFIKNPGRIDSLKDFSGLDKEIEDFFRIETNMISYLEDVYRIIKMAMDTYLIEDRYTNIQINFGCTGGIHRSVFAVKFIEGKLKEDFPKESLSIKHKRLSKI